MTDSKAATFWKWFLDHMAEIEDASRAFDHDWLRSELSPRVARLTESCEAPMQWEVGPDWDGGWYFAFSPRVRGNLPAAKMLAASAPDLSGWKVYPAKPPKPVENALRIDFADSLGRRWTIDATEWECVLRASADGSVGILLAHPDDYEWGEDDPERVARLLLENLLGELVVLTRLSRIHALSDTDIPDKLARERLDTLRSRILADD